MKKQFADQGYIFFGSSSILNVHIVVADRIGSLLLEVSIPAEGGLFGEKGGHEQRQRKREGGR